MTRITWGSFGTRHYEVGVDRGVFYPNVGAGIPWNGLVAVREGVSDEREVVTYVDGQPYRSKKADGSFTAVVEAFTYPFEFEPYNEVFSSKRQKPFGFSYRTMADGDHYCLHLVYNALAAPSAAGRNTVASDGAPTVFSWELSSKPVPVPGMRPSAHFIIDSRQAVPDALVELEDVLYGTLDSIARFPTVPELLDIFERNAILVVIDHGDGTWSAIGPDEAIKMLDADTFQISWPSAVYLDENTYQISSL